MLDGNERKALPRPGDTHCPYCAFQCGMRIVEGRGGFGVEARDFPTNRGAMCRKGWTSTELLRAPDRLTTPLVRAHKGAPLEPTGWDEAIARIVGDVRDVQRRCGRDAVAVFGGGGLGNEAAYMLGKFARAVLRTKNIDYNGRYCMSSAAAAGQRAFGLDRGLPFPVSDLAEADAVMLVGANPAETMPPIMQYFDEQRARGGRLIVVDPRRTPTAEAATLHLQLAPGTDGALANGLLHVAIRDGLLDEAFIASRTTGFSQVRHVVGSYWPDRVERITGVPVPLLVEAAHLLAEADKAFVITARGAEQQSQGVRNTLAFINLALALGKVGKRGCGYGCLTGQGNGQGGREHGQKADQLPGYRRLDDPEHRAHVARVWGIDPSELPPPGLPASELLAEMGETGISALLVMGCNLVVSAPDAGALERRLSQLRLLVVSDIFVSDTAKLADVVLPVTQWAEGEGTVTNFEGRVLLRSSAAKAPPGVRSDLQILKSLAVGLGRGELIEERPEAAFEELRRASASGPADYAGISYARLRLGEQLFWPCPNEDHPGTPRPFLEKFATPDGRARFHAVQHIGPAEATDDEYPLVLTTGRVLAHYQSGTQTMRVPSLREAEPTPFVEIHPQLAAAFGVVEGDWVRLRTRRGHGLFAVRLRETMRLDTVFVPFHYGGLGRANLLTGRAVDPISKIPEFKFAAVALEPVALDAPESKAAEARARPP